MLCNENQTRRKTVAVNGSKQRNRSTSNALIHIHERYHEGNHERNGNSGRVFDFLNNQRFHLPFALVSIEKISNTGDRVLPDVQTP